MADDPYSLKQGFRPFLCAHQWLPRPVASLTDTNSRNPPTLMNYVPVVAGLSFAETRNMSVLPSSGIMGAESTEHGHGL